MTSPENSLNRFGVTRFRVVEALDVAAASPAQLDELGIRVPSAAWAREHLPNGLTLVRPELKTLRGIYHGPVRGLNPTNETNDIWSGVVLSPPPLEGTSQPPFTSVAAQWNVPTVTAPLNDSGHLVCSVWIGIDGFGGPDVMQAGTDQEIAPDGSTDYSCWLEWFPADTVVISSLPVKAGDMVYFNVRRLSSTEADLLAIVAGKGISMTFDAPAGTTLSGQTAEWIVERPSMKVGSKLVPFDLPEFQPVHFREVGAFTDQSHVPGADSIILSITENGTTVTRVDQVGLGSFDVSFRFPFPRATTAFQHRDTDLFVAEMRSARGDMGLGMMAGTSPSVATFQSDKWQGAFQANTGNLWIVGTQDDRGDMGLGMMAGTSPAIATVNDNWQAAFQANTGNLWVIGTQDSRGDMKLGMKAGTSPAITGFANGHWQAAFQANTSNLWIVGTQDSRGDMGLGMMAGTSPAITGFANGHWQATFQANTGNLWVIGTQDNHGDMGLGMKAGTSPSIVAFSDGTWQAAFQANTGNLWVAGSNSANRDTGLGMMAGTSPAIGLTVDSWCVLFQANTGELWKYTPEWGGERLNLPMGAGTSPAISGVRPLSPVIGGF
jgi:hypothetical protein